MSRTLSRASAVLAATALGVPLWGVPSAAAATASEPASNGAYFYRGGLTSQGTPLEPVPQPIPNATGEQADGVSAGNLAVSAQGGQEDKVSFLQFSLAAVPLDSTVDSAVLTVPLVPSAPPNDLVYNAAPANVRVCKAGDRGFFGEDAQSITLAPDRLCEEFSSAPGKLSADGKAYVFDVTGLAATWLEANDGLALTVTEEAMASAFQVVFAPATQATLAYSFTPPAGTTVPDVPSDVVAPVTPDLGTGSTGGGALDLGGTGLDTGVAAPPLVDTALPPAPAVVAPAAPQVAGAPVQVAPVASVSAVLAPTPLFWLAGLALAAVLALLSLVMGDPRVPTATAKPSRLTRALQQREQSAVRRAPALRGRTA